MRREVKELLQFFELLGKVDYEDNISDEVEAYYSINLIPDQSPISAFQLNRLEELVKPNKVKIWFFYSPDTERNECHIDIEIQRRKEVK
jgi:hypothetical protein